MISIHAPAKGATNVLDAGSLALDISIHAPAKGATAILWRMRVRLSHFNPRSREGSDRTWPARLHALSQFQSTLPRRERLSVRRGRSRAAAFQSTLPRRERRYRRCMALRRSSDFNPRSREGSDLRSIYAAAAGERFQSTLPRRERHAAPVTDATRRAFQSTLPRRERRREYRAGTNAILISIHAPAKGATGEDQVCYISQGHFNPRSREGSDMRDDKADIKDRLFQSTLPRRERHTLTPYLYIDTKISIHAPAKGATVIFLHRFHI